MSNFSWLSFTSFHRFRINFHIQPFGIVCTEWCLALWHRPLSSLLRDSCSHIQDCLNLCPLLSEEWLFVTGQLVACVTSRASSQSEWTHSWGTLSLFEVSREPIELIFIIAVGAGRSSETLNTCIALKSKSLDLLRQLTSHHEPLHSWFQGASSMEFSFLLKQRKDSPSKWSS